MALTSSAVALRGGCFPHVPGPVLLPVAVLSRHVAAWRTIIGCLPARTMSCMFSRCVPHVRFDASTLLGALSL